MALDIPPEDVDFSRLTKICEPYDNVGLFDFLEYTDLDVTYLFQYSMKPEKARLLDHCAQGIVLKKLGCPDPLQFDATPQAELKKWDLTLKEVGLIVLMPPTQITHWYYTPKRRKLLNLVVLTLGFRRYGARMDALEALYRPYREAFKQAQTMEAMQ